MRRSMGKAPRPMNERYKKGGKGLPWKSGSIKLKDKVYCYEVSECEDCGVMLDGDKLCFRCSI